MTIRGSGTVRGAGRPPGGSLLARGEEHEAGADHPGSSTVVCQSCRYSNPVSQAFYTLSVRHLYCRRCGRMVDREGREVSPA